MPPRPRRERTPPRPMVWIVDSQSKVIPVAQMIASSSISRPAVVTIPSGTTRAMAEVTKSTWGCASAQ